MRCFNQKEEQRLISRGKLKKGRNVELPQKRKMKTPNAYGIVLLAFNLHL
jgi:hypothetical protein